MSARQFISHYHGSWRNYFSFFSLRCVLFTAKISRLLSFELQATEYKVEHNCFKKAEHQFSGALLWSIKKICQEFGNSKILYFNCAVKTRRFFIHSSLFPFSLISLCNSISSGHKFELKPHLKCLNFFALDNKTANQGDVFLLHLRFL